MPTANAVTGITGLHLLGGLDPAAPPAYQQPIQKRASPPELGVAWASCKLGRLLGTDFEFLARLAVADGKPLNADVSYRRARRTRHLQIKAGNTVYVLRASVHASYTLPSEDQSGE